MFDDVQENLSKLREKIENEDRIKSPVRLSKGDIVEMELDEMMVSLWMGNMKQGENIS